MDESMPLADSKATMHAKTPPSPPCLVLTLEADGKSTQITNAESTTSEELSMASDEIY
jgi:hypothetical protein